MALLTNNQLAVVNEKTDILFEHLARPVTVVYPATWQDCATCALAGVNTWTTGARVRVGDGSSCPECGATGKHAVEATEALRVAVAWSSGSFFIPAHRFLGGTHNDPVPAGLVQTKSKAADTPKLVQAVSLLVTPEGGPGPWRLERCSDPMDPQFISRGRYAVILWKRVP